MIDRVFYISAVNYLESTFKPLFLYARRNVEDAWAEALSLKEDGSRKTLAEQERQKHWLSFVNIVT